MRPCIPLDAAHALATSGSRLAVRKSGSSQLRGRTGGAAARLS